MDYILAVQTPAYPLSSAAFAVESAFAEHLRELRKSIGDRFAKIVLLAPQLSDADYAAQRHHLSTIEFSGDGIEFIPTHSETTTAAHFWLRTSFPLWRRLKAAVRNAGVVHSGMAFDVRWPMLAILNLAAWTSGRPVMFITDIDFRQNASRSYSLGVWSWKKYAINRLVLDPFRSAQVWFAARKFQLVMLKSASMVERFGRGQAHVKNFYNTVHAEEHILSRDESALRAEWLREKSRPLQMCYFGRIIWRKGLDRMITALGIARARGCDAHLTIIGEGPHREVLMKQVEDEGLAAHVTFRTQVAYGAPLFDHLSGMHLSLNAPLVEDTPRSAFDSMARGVPLLAFDISYFADLAEPSGAIALAAWPDAASLAEQMIALDKDRDRLADMAVRGVQFARENTQQIWLERRAQWMRHFCLGDPLPAEAGAAQTSPPFAA